MSVRVRAPSRGLVSRVPGESADQMPATGGIIPGTMQRAASRASNVRYEDGVVAAAPGYQTVQTQTPLLSDDLIAYWHLDELSGTRFDSTPNHRDLTEVDGFDLFTETVLTVREEVGILRGCALFPAITYAPVILTEDSLSLTPSLDSGSYIRGVFLCPTVSTHPSLDLVASSGVGTWAYGDQRHSTDFSTRQLWMSNRSNGVLGCVDTVTNLWVSLVDLRSGHVTSPLVNTWCVWDSKNDRIIVSSQAGLYYFINPNTFTIINPSSPVSPSNGAPAGSPPDHAFCYDSTRGQILVGYAVSSTGQFSIIDGGSMSEVAAFGLPSSNDWTGHQYNPVLDKYYVGHTSTSGGTFPFTYLDPVAHTIVNSALTTGPCASLFYLPEIQVLVYTKSDGSVYVVDGTSSPVALGGSGETQNQVIRSVADGGGALMVGNLGRLEGVAYDACANTIVFSDTINMWQVNTSTFVSTAMSVGGNFGVWFDKYSNWIFGADYTGGLLKTY